MRSSDVIVAAIASLVVLAVGFAIKNANAGGMGVIPWGGYLGSSGSPDTIKDNRATLPVTYAAQWAATNRTINSIVDNVYGLSTTTSKDPLLSSGYYIDAPSGYVAVDTLPPV